MDHFFHHYNLYLYALLLVGSTLQASEINKGIFTNTGLIARALDSFANKINEIENNELSLSPSMPIYMTNQLMDGSLYPGILGKYGLPRLIKTEEQHVTFVVGIGIKRLRKDLCQDDAKEQAATLFDKEADRGIKDLQFFFRDMYHSKLLQDVLNELSQMESMAWQCCHLTEGAFQYDQKLQKKHEKLQKKIKNSEKQLQSWLIAKRNKVRDKVDNIFFDLCKNKGVKQLEARVKKKAQSEVKASFQRMEELLKQQGMIDIITQQVMLGLDQVAKKSRLELDALVKGIALNPWLWFFLWGMVILVVTTVTLVVMGAHYLFSKWQYKKPKPTRRLAILKK